MKRPFDQERYTRKARVPRHCEPRRLPLKAHRKRITSPATTHHPAATTHRLFACVGRGAQRRSHHRTRVASPCRLTALHRHVRTRLGHAPRPAGGPGTNRGRLRRFGSSANTAKWLYRNPHIRSCVLLCIRRTSPTAKRRTGHCCTRPELAQTSLGKHRGQQYVSVVVPAPQTWI